MLILSLFQGLLDDLAVIGENLLSQIESFWRDLLLTICTTVYKWIVYLYDLFQVVGTSQILTSELIESLYNRVGLILSIYMLFRLIFSFIQMLINPDYISDKEKGVANIVKKCLLTIILLGITPYLFEKSIEFQNFIVGSDSTKSNVIARLIMPDTTFSEQSSFGASLSAFMFDSFYQYNSILTEDEAVKACSLFRKNIAENTSQLAFAIRRMDGDVSIAKYCLNTTLYDLGYGMEKDDEGNVVKDDEGNVVNNNYAKYYKGEYVVSFSLTGLIAVVAGIFVCYILGTYVIMAGTRVIQLAFLRIIAPMAILSYLSPKKDTMFEKWLKMCGTTYIDLFIRLGIIYFIVFVIQVIMTNGVTLTTLNEPDNMWLINLVMILALLLFAKKAPDLLKELFPKTGAASLGFGLKSPKNFINSMAGGAIINKGISKAYKGAVKTGKGLVRGTAGFGAGALLGLGAGLMGSDKKLTGTLGGALRGGLTGMKKGGVKKVVGNQREINQKYRELHEDGGNWLDMKISAVEQKVGMVTKGEKNEKVMTAYDNIQKTNKSLNDYAEGEMMKMKNPTGKILDYKNERAKLDILKASPPIDINDYKIKGKDGKVTINYESYNEAVMKHAETVTNQEELVNKMKKEATAEWENKYAYNDENNKAVVDSYVEQVKSYAKAAGIDYDYIAKEKIKEEDGTERNKTLSEIMKEIKDKAERGSAKLSIDEAYIKQKAADEAAKKKN